MYVKPHRSDNSTRRVNILFLLLASLTIIAILLFQIPNDTPAPAPTLVSPVSPLSDHRPLTTIHYLYLPAIVNHQPHGLANADFEAGQWRATRYWVWPWQEAHTQEFGEISPPVGWVAWWVDRRFCPRYETYKSGRPEVTLITIEQDQNRVSSGDQAAKWFTFWRCHLGGLYQVLPVHPGTYQFCVELHHWYSDCSTKPYSPPLESDCRTPAEWTGATLQVGIDPKGGEDYWSSNIIWSHPTSIYGTYDGNICTVPAAVDNQLSVWIRSETQAPLKHEDIYIDHAQLYSTTLTLQTPTMLPTSGGIP
jgi:hypothetical protein